MMHRRLPHQSLLASALFLFAVALLLNHQTAYGRNEQERGNWKGASHHHHQHHHQDQQQTQTQDISRGNGPPSEIDCSLSPAIDYSYYIERCHDDLRQHWINGMCVNGIKDEYTELYRCVWPDGSRPYCHDCIDRGRVGSSSGSASVIVKHVCGADSPDMSEVCEIAASNTGKDCGTTEQQQQGGGSSLTAFWHQCKVPTVGGGSSSWYLRQDYQCGVDGHGGTVAETGPSPGYEHETVPEEFTCGQNWYYAFGPNEYHYGEEEHPFAIAENEYCLDCGMGIQVCAQAGEASCADLGLPEKGFSSMGNSSSTSAPSDGDLMMGSTTNAPSADGLSTDAPALSASPTASHMPIVKVMTPFPTPATSEDALSSSPTENVIGKATDAPTFDAPSFVTSSPTYDALSYETQSPSPDALSSETMGPTSDTLVLGTSSPSSDAPSSETLSPSSDTLNSDSQSPTTSDVLDSETQTPSSGTLGSETLSPTYSDTLSYDETQSPSSDPLKSETQSPSSDTLSSGTMNPTSDALSSQTLSPSSDPLSSGSSSPTGDQLSTQPTKGLSTMSPSSEIDSAPVHGSNGTETLTPSSASSVHLLPTSTTNHSNTSIPLDPANVTMSPTSSLTDDPLASRPTFAPGEASSSPSPPQPITTINPVSSSPTDVPYNAAPAESPMPTEASGLSTSEPTRSSDLTTTEPTDSSALSTSKPTEAQFGRASISVVSLWTCIMLPLILVFSLCGGN